MAPLDAQGIAEAYLKGRLPMLPSVRSKPSRLYAYQVSAAAVAANGVQTQFVTTDADSHFLVEAVAAISSLETSSQDLMTVQISDTSSGQAWSNQAVRIRDFAGYAASPKYLKHPQLLRPSTTVQAQFTSVNGSNAMDCDIVLIGRKVFGVTPDEEILMKKRLWFQYVTPVTLTTGQRTNFTLQILNESDFLAFTMGSSLLWSAVAAGANVNLSWQDSSSGLPYMNTLINAKALFGASAMTALVASGAYTLGMGPFCLPKPAAFRRNASVTWDIQNEYAGTLTFDLVWDGVRIFTPTPIV